MPCDSSFWATVLSAGIAAITGIFSTLLTVRNLSKTNKISLSRVYIEDAFHEKKKAYGKILDMIDKYSELAYSFSKDKTEAIEEANKAKEQMSSKFMFLFNNDERFRLYCSQKVLDLFGECTVHFMLVDSIGKGEQLSLFEKDKQKLNRQIGKELNIDSIE